MIGRWSSNYKHELRALCSQELELREKFKAYRAEEHHRLLEVKSHSFNFKFGCKFPDGWTKTYCYFGHCIIVNLVEILFLICYQFVQFFSDFRVQSTIDTNASGSTKPLQTMERLLSAKKATLDLKSVLTVEAANAALQKVRRRIQILFTR